MKKLFALILMLLCVGMTFAQQDGHRRFDPQKFQADMEQFITQEAALSPQEAEAFFPVFREMCKKQRVLFDQQRRLRHIKPADESGCREAVVKLDDLELQIRETQRHYHQIFLKILPASKVYDILKAEERYHRQVLRKASEHRKR